MSAIAFSPRAAALQFEPSAGEATIRAAVRAGDLKMTTVGKRRYIRAVELDRWLKTLEDGNSQDA